jgi:hypothetical protein
VLGPDFLYSYRTRGDAHGRQLLWKNGFPDIPDQGTQHGFMHLGKSRKLGNIPIKLIGNDYVIRHGSTRATFSPPLSCGLLAFLGDEGTGSQVVFLRESFCASSSLRRNARDRKGRLRSTFSSSRVGKFKVGA